MPKKRKSPAGGATAPAKPKKAKKSKGKPKSAPLITVAQYNALWLAYSEDPNVRAAAKAAGVLVNVARWYCEGAARPDVGFVQLAARLRTIQTTVAEVNDHGTGKWRAEQLKVLQEGLRTTETGLAIHRRGIRELGEKIQKNELSASELVLSKEFAFKDMVNSHDKLLRAALLTMGEPDSATATMVKGPENLNFGEWTSEECLTYHERGIIPERWKK